MYFWYKLEEKEATMTKSDFELEKTVTISVNGVERKFLLANFHEDWKIMSLLTNSLKNLQGMEEVKE